MPSTLQVNSRSATMDGHPPVAIVELSGSIDPSTLETLESAMDRCAAEKKHRVVFDLKDIHYINSTGMGMLVQFSDACREAGGGLALARVQPKVLLVIEMLGLQELFHIVADEAAAFSALDGGPPGAIRVDEASPAAATPTGVFAAVAARDAASESMPPAAAPVVAACPACQAELTLPPGAGRYRCPRCLSTLELAAGDVRATPEDAMRVAELWLPPHGNFLDPAVELIAKAGARSGLPDASARAAARAAAACWKKLAAMLLRHGGKGDRRLRVLVRADDGRLVVRTHCGGDAVDPSAFDAARPDVDKLEYAATPQGNLLTLVKDK